jgi:rhodanese-related sulfurtransferase
MKKLQMILISALSVLVLIPATTTTAIADAAQAKPKYPPQVKEMVMEARKHIKTINMEEFKKVVDDPQGAMIVDVREPKAYAAGHVPGAINVPRGLIEFKIWKHVGFPDNTDYGKKMYLYCATGGRCTLATKSLQDLGFTDVTAATIKLEDWLKAGYPLVK